ncbi:MAG: NADPH:quinone reductase [Nocardioides sp.]
MGSGVVTSRAVVYSDTGGPEVLQLVDREVPEPGPGEVRVRLRVAGVNPTDWKFRTGLTGPMSLPEVCPGQDGAGEVDAVGAGVGLALGQRVWVWLAGGTPYGGTAREHAVLPARSVRPLPDRVSLETGACLGVPAVTAHRCLTVAEGGPVRLAPGALAGRTVLVAGGAGAVGHAAIELARWAGATVLATVSGPTKAELAGRAGAHHVVDYRHEDAAARIRQLAPDGVDVVVEVAPVANADLDAAVIATGGTIAIYANDEATAAIPVRAHMLTNTRYQFVLLYTVVPDALEAAAAAVSEALVDGALRSGEGAGLPLHRYPLAEAGAAHAAVEAHAVGKVLLEL